MFYVIMILLGLLVIAVAVNLLNPIGKSIFNPDVPREGELARFVDYLGCAVVMCAHGCRSDEVIMHELEYEDGEVVLSCQQLIDDYGWCDALPDGQRLCGGAYAFNFTFKEAVTYKGNYSVNSLDTETYGTCGLGDSGWHTDVSCVGRWEEGGKMDYACRHCKLNYRTAYTTIPVPMGVIFNYNNGSECNARGNERPLGHNYDAFAGSLWVSENYANVNCKGYSNPWSNLNSCNFGEGETFRIWAIENGQSVTFWEFDLFGVHQKWYIACQGPSYYPCPKIIICDH